MSRNANTSTTNSKGKEKDAFIEFDYSSGANAAHGRIYLDNEKSTDTYSIVPISLTLNGLAIKGCRVYIPRETMTRGQESCSPHSRKITANTSHICICTKMMISHS